MHIVRAGEGRIIDGQGSTLKVLLEPGASPVRSALMGIVEVGAGVRLPAEEDRFSSHDCEELSYVISGSLRVWVEGHEVVLGPGDAMLTQPGERHWVKNEGDEPAVALFVLAPPIRL
ncbi:MAG: cupin domain-containing protein [Thermaerobacter sp.]|nr:hypothetical protein [Bacillota bacterium]REJ36024.1 MAG: hypothetical protein DIU84_06470 [Bacillota bacterium]